jgi:hypothetical protein
MGWPGVLIDELKAGKLFFILFADFVDESEIFRRANDSAARQAATAKNWAAGFFEITMLLLILAEVLRTEPASP